MVICHFTLIQCSNEYFSFFCIIAICREDTFPVRKCWVFVGMLLSVIATFITAIPLFLILTDNEVSTFYVAYLYLCVCVCPRERERIPLKVFKQLPTVTCFLGRQFLIKLCVFQLAMNLMKDIVLNTEAQKGRKEIMQRHERWA